MTKRRWRCFGAVFSRSNRNGFHPQRRMRYNPPPMSYLVLARKYRSQTFDDVVGQDHVAKTLKRAIESGRVAHAYLFCGTRGVGKTSMARIMAKALNCEKSDGPTTEPCGKCNSCLAIARGEDIDVIEIDAASNTQVEKTRDIIANAQFRPARSRFKIYIIDEVHMLSKASFNALLKTMEEPPEHVKFILATTEAEKVLPTILSRCQRYDFRNIPTREIVEHLQTICKAEKIKADDDALMLVAKAGAGSMRDALSLLDRLLSVGEKHITLDLIEQTLGMPKAQSIFELAQSIGQGDVKGALEGADKLMSGGLSADTLVASLADHFRNLLILRTCGAKSNLVEVAGISIDDLASQAGKFEPVVLTQDIAILEELRRNLRTTQAGRALLDATLVRLALAEQFATVDELIGRVNGAPLPARSTSTAAPLQKKKPELGEVVGGQLSVVRENTTATTDAPVQPAAAGTASAGPSFTPVASSDDEDDDLPRPGKVWDNSGPSLAELLKQRSGAAPSPTAPVASNVEPIRAGDLDELRDKLLSALAQKGPSLPALLKDAALVGIENDQAVLRYAHDQEPLVKMLDRNGKKETIRDVLSALIGKAVSLKFELAEAPPEPAATTPAPTAAPPRKPAPRFTPPPAPTPEPTIRITEEIKQQLMTDELIKAAVETLGGEIVKVEG
jgi:DNA polymerase-3 subunit gamma/tau